MNDLEKLLVVNCKLQLLIAEQKLEVCNESGHNTRHLQADMLKAEIEVLTQLIESYD